jgi:peptidoglycan/xylan/chitin deacetylase (PgdA/CDA1 family)
VAGAHPCWTFHFTPTSASWLNAVEGFFRARGVLGRTDMEFFEYLPENRPTQPDIPHYSRMDYGNHVGFWRMLDVLNTNSVRACCYLNVEILDHFPEIKDAMVASDCDYMAHGLYNSRAIYDYTKEQEQWYLAGLHHPFEGDDPQTPERSARRRCWIHCQDRRFDG